jgi:thiol-disulfide isomerase/thioredoxin
LNQSAIAKEELEAEGLNEALAAIDYSDERLLKSEIFQEFAEMRINERVNSIMLNDSTLERNYETFSRLFVEQLDSVFDNPRIAEFLRFSNLRDLLSYSGPANAEKQVEAFFAINTNKKYEGKINALLAQWEPIGVGKEVPDFTFEDINGNSVSLASLKGKLVYIDIWATWCGPCIAEHPYWDQLKEDYKDQPVAFLTVSIDNTKEPWVKMVKAKKMDGLQWYAEGAWSSELAQHFMVNAIPRFLLLDQDLKIINPSADRPSGKIREVLDQYLEAI